MPIATNNNNLGTTIGNLYTGNGMEVQYFTVVVKDSSATAMDLRAHDDSSGNFHKDGLVDRVLQIAQTRGTIVYFNVKNDNSGTITIGMEGEFGTATNIKSRVNRLSVLSAITSTQQKLKLFKSVPDNGLVIYCGTILTDDNKEKK